MPQGPLLDRQFLEKLERLTIHWQKSFNGLVGGHNNSLFAGGGQEFLDHRHFHHGDDLRAVNWRAYLRLEKMFLKMFQVEPRVPVRMLIDTSESMNSEGGFKFDLRAQTRRGALLRRAGATGHDRDPPVRRAIGRRHDVRRRPAPLQPGDGLPQRARTGGRTNYLEVVRQFISTHQQRGLLIIVSDFLDDAGCEKPLQYLADFGHELLLVQVWSEEDRTPPWLGDLDLVDAETEERLQLQFDETARDSYTRSFDKYADSLQQLALRNGGRYVGVSAAMPIEDIIFGSLVRSRVIA